MNSLNREVVEMIAEALDYVDINGAGLIIGNQATGIPGAFSVGGDLLAMAVLAKKKNFAEIESLLRLAQQTYLKARYAPFPVVAAPFGMTLGGGCEICLACDRIVAHTELYMGLVEIGVGLLPAAGGCLNFWRKFMSTIPESVRDIDLIKFFKPVFRTVATAKVSSSAAEAGAMGFLGHADRIVFNRDYLIGEAKKEVLRMVEEGYSPPLERRIQVLGQAGQGVINSEISHLREGKFISEYDAYLAQRIAFVMCGGDVRDNTEIEEDVILKLERDAFIDFWRQEKTVARVAHMLKTGKPLRN
jgi:3-hydroxyacyl-CoA dehydrogenase